MYLLLPHDPYLDQWRSLSLVRGGLFGLVLSRKAAILGAALVNLFGESPASKMGDIFLEMRGRVISSKWSYGLLDCFWSPVSRGWSSSGKTTETTAHPMKNVEVSVEFPRPTNLCLSLTGNLAQPVLLASDLDAFWVLMTRSSTKWYKSDSSPRFLWCMLFQLGSHQSVNQNCWALQDLREILKILML